MHCMIFLLKRARTYKDLNTMQVLTRQMITLHRTALIYFNARKNPVKSKNAIGQRNSNYNFFKDANKFSTPLCIVQVRTKILMR